MRVSARDGGAQVLGREAELAALDGFLDPEGPSRALVLTGGPGVGKTTLWEAGIELARARGMLVLVARPSEAEARQSLTAVADLLAEVGESTLAALPTPRKHALEVALLRREPWGEPPEPRAVSTGFLDVLRELAVQDPLLVAVDDVHWLDRRSADVLAFAGRRLVGSAVRFLLSRRTGASPPLERSLETGGLERVEIGGISLGAARRLLAERVGLTLHRRALRSLVESTRGNPLFVLELGRLLVERGSPPGIGGELSVPERIEDLLGVRVTRLPRTVRRALLAVALSADVRISQLEAVVGSAALDEALAARVVVAEGDRVRGAHPLLAAAARTHSRRDERRELHRALAAVVDEELESSAPGARRHGAGRGAVEDDRVGRFARSRTRRGRRRGRASLSMRSG